MFKKNSAFHKDSEVEAREEYIRQSSLQHGSDVDQAAILRAVEAKMQDILSEDDGAESQSKGNKAFKPKRKR